MTLADVKWIKITTDMFDNRKIRHLRRLPDGNNIVLIWVMLLTMAGRCNSGGMIFLTENIPYTPKMLADELDFEETTVQLALNALERFNMIVTKQGFFSIAGWDEYQNIEGMDKIREQNRIRKANYDARKKELLASNVTGNVTVTQSNATDIEEEKEIEIDSDIKKESITCQQIVDLYHSICTSFPSVRSISAARQKAIKARLNTYSLDDFRTVFENAEASSFLKGANDRNWSATFDWLMKDQNMAKVLEGNYADKPQRGYGRKEVVPAWMQNEPSDFTKRAVQRLMSSADNPELSDRAERLKKELQGG